MQIIAHIPDYADIVLAIIGAASIIVKALAKGWKITPGTPDTDVFTRSQRFIHRLQKVLGPIAGDTSKDEAKK